MKLTYTFILLTIILVACTTIEPMNEKDALDIAIEDEYKAFNTYEKVIERLGEVKPFINIINAEQAHIDSLKELYTKYNYEVPTNKGNFVEFTDLKNACQTGVAAEIANIEIYDGLLAKTTNQEMINTFKYLQSASRDNHLPAFKRCS